MMPDIDLREERKKKRARAGICVIAGPMTVLMLIQPGWKWVPVVGVIAITAICAIAVSGELPGGHRGAAASAGTAAMMTAGLPTRRRTGGTCWSWCRG